MNHPSSCTCILDNENIDIKNRSRSKKNNGIGKIYFSSGKEKRGGNGLPAGPKCFECHGYGHFSHECVNMIKKKTNFKANIIKDDDIELDNPKEEQIDNTNFVAFGVSLQSNFSEHESSDDSDDEEGDEFEDVQELREKYEMLYKESVKIVETNLELAKKYKESNVELEIAKKQVEEFQRLLSDVTSERDKLRKEVGSLQEKNGLLIESDTICEGKVKELNIELTSANNVFERLNTGSKKLNNILDVQRATSDRSGLGFHGASSSKQIGGKLNEAKAKEVMPKFCPINIAKNIVKKPLDSKKATPPKFIPTCHYCQVKGHIRPNCFKLHGYPTAKHSYAINNRGSCDHFAPRWNNVQMPRPVGYNDDHTINMNPRHISIVQSESSQVKTRPIWVRRCDLHCLATNMVSKARKIYMWNLNGGYSRHMSSDTFGRGMPH
ncbi:hypothetical protein RHGRI_005244 [Rhododendron griersonianum]|uniref:CCHC-type domain-containing protein n=2 Tax=Rhododendron griersonianum TaxID=479676 RepID=A0AAV6LCJ4_9ERIC|nr:hypothetical protein RHGRI_005244 [Rhododendron griersonianum]